jgi:hypothetical protein
MEHDSSNITQHAWDRFIERWCGARPTCWRKELYRLLETSIQEDLGHGAVLRLIAHQYQSAAYFTAEGWRFVVDSDTGMLLTCELAYKKGICKKPKPFNRKRCGR